MNTVRPSPEPPTPPSDRRRLRVYAPSPTPSPTEGKNGGPTEHTTAHHVAGQVREDGGSGRARVTALLRARPPSRDPPRGLLTYFYYGVVTILAQLGTGRAIYAAAGRPSLSKARIGARAASCVFVREEQEGGSAGRGR